MKRLPLSLVLLTSIFLNVQAHPDSSLHRYDDNLHTWVMYYGDLRLSEKSGIHLEAQWRRSGPVLNPQQLLLRTGVNYHLSTAVMLTAGYCFVHTSPYGNFPAASGYPENRLWQQVQAKARFGMLEWTGWLRTEQRFSKLPVLDVVSGEFVPGEAVYTNRFRQLNRLSIPFTGKEITDRTFYLSVYDEIFINSGRSIAANFLDQNRAYVAIGYRFPKIGRLELGFMEQTVFKPDGIRIERNHTLQISLISTIDCRK